MKRLVIYLAVTFGLTWGVLIPAGLALGTFQNGENSSAAMFGFVAASMFFPLVGAFATNAACKPDERIDLAWKPFVRGNVRYYLAAWLVPAGVTLLGATIFFMVFPQWFDPTMQSYLVQTAEVSGMSADQVASQLPPMPVLFAALTVAAIAVAPFVNMIFAFGEEVGWRGMLLPTLCEYAPVRVAAPVSGTIWGLWHAPVVCMGHNYGMGYPGFPAVGILAMVLACMAVSCWFALLRQRSGSVWPCALAHGAINATANLGLLFSSCGSTLFGPTPLGLVAGIPLFVLGFASWLRLSPSAM